MVIMYCLLFRYECQESFLEDNFRSRISGDGISYWRLISKHQNYNVCDCRYTVVQCVSWPRLRLLNHLLLTSRRI